MSAVKRARAWAHENKGLLKKAATGSFVCLIIVLLIKVGLTIEWNEVMRAILETPTTALWLAFGLVAVSYAVYGSFDLLGKRYTGHGLSWPRTMMVAIIAYAFTMNFSAAVGGLAMRLRLYGKQGLEPGQIVRIMGLSITTNWIGYCLLAGIVFAAGAVNPPAAWEVSGGPLRVVGGLMVLAAGAYVALCAFSERRSWKVRDHTIELPQLNIALWQLLLATVNWSLMGLVIYTLMPGEAGYATILGTLLVGSLVGALAHIPGGLGVTEYVFITMLSPEQPRYQVLGAILVYRAVYYVIPVLLAGAWYLFLEMRGRGRVSRGTEIA